MRMLTDPTDEYLAQLIQKGDHQALATLMERYTARLLRYGKRFMSSNDDIGDVVQDVFVTVYENIQDFDATRQFWLNGIM